MERRDLEWWLCLGLVAVAVLWLRVWPHLEEGGTAFPGYWVVGRALLAGQPVVELYDDAVLAGLMEAAGFTPDKLFGPPSLVLTLAPLAWLPVQTARAVFMVGVLWPALMVSLALLFRPLGRAGLVLFAMVALGQPVAANMEVAQIYPLMLLAHAVGLWAWARDRPAVGGLALAPMIVARGWYGLPQALGWAVARRPMGTLYTGAVSAAVLLATLPLVGLAAWRYFIEVQVPAAGVSETAFALAYQTWRSLALHLTTLHPRWSPDPPLTALGPGLWVAGVVIIGVITLWAGSRCRPGSDGGRGFALWTAAALLLAPVAEDHHFVLAALPLASAWRDGHRVVVALACVLLLPAWPFDQPDLLGGWRALAAYPRVYGVGLLWAVLAWEGLSRSAARGRSPSPSP